VSILGLYSQYQKFFTRILVVLLPTLVLHLNFGSSGDTKKTGYDFFHTQAPNPIITILGPFYYLNYFASIAVLPEEETVAVHFIKTAVRYFYFPQRCLSGDLCAVALPLFHLNLSVFLFLRLFKKPVDNTHEIAVHTGGHAPPSRVVFKKCFIQNR
jgi:hypothetical protein